MLTGRSLLERFNCLLIICKFPWLLSITYLSIHICILGDKVETAQTIAVSSRLMSRNQSMYLMTRISDLQIMREYLSDLSSKNDHCLIIDGTSLQLCLEAFRKEFAEVVMKLPVVVCCRCSPEQKAEITNLVKDNTRCRVAAIGDGGNDVSMIQAAHVGIGIVGKEGKQASLAADFSLTQFGHLPKLILYHGRNNCKILKWSNSRMYDPLKNYLDKRSAALSQFVFHRGLIISVIQAVFCSVFYFSPIPLYQVRRENSLYRVKLPCLTRSFADPIL